MAERSKQEDGHARVLSKLNAAIDNVTRAEGATGVEQVKVAFSSANTVLSGIRDSMSSKQSWVNLAMVCADVCGALERRTNDTQDQLDPPLSEAVGHLVLTVTEIQNIITGRSKQNVMRRLFHAISDKRRINTWKSAFDRILHDLNAAATTDTHVHTASSHAKVASTSIIIPDVHDNQNLPAHTSAPGMLAPPPQAGNSDIIVRRKLQEAGDVFIEIRDKVARTPPSDPGESPSLPPNVFFGREEIVGEIVGYAERLTSVVLRGVGGIGKTSIALTTLDDERIIKRFGDHRRFVPCDKFPASLPNFLRRLSEVIGAGIKNPESLDPLHSFLSSQDMFIVLDNAESVLDPEVPSSREIYDVVERLNQYNNICLCVTSRVSTVPPGCKTFDIPPLSMEPARKTFYTLSQYNERPQDDEQSKMVDNLLERLEFHPLSIVLLATVAYHNKWDIEGLSKAWEERRTGVLKTVHNKSLAATIELSLTSPLFQGLGLHARELLEIVAFFPQGVDEDKLEWLFPSVPDGPNIFDGFCILSLTNRTGGFATMLAPLRDYLSPKDPASSSLLHTIKECYFSRMSVDLDNPAVPGFEGARWITSEDLNVEHLLDVFTSVDANSNDVWKACADFMRHIFWFKKRLIMLRPKIEGLPDDHPYKPECLFELSQVFSSVGAQTAKKELLIHALQIWREREDGYRITQMLIFLAYTNRQLALYGEGISQAREASEVCERFNIESMQAHSLRCLAWLLRDDGQLDAAEEAASNAIDAHMARDEKFCACQSRRILAIVCHRKGKTEEAIGHFKTALDTASTSKWSREIFWIHYCMAELFFDVERFDDAYDHIKLAKSHDAGDNFNLGRGMQLQAEFFYKQQRFEEAQSEVEEAIKLYEKIGTTLDLEKCRKLLQDIENELKNPTSTRRSNGNGRVRG